MDVLHGVLDIDDRNQRDSDQAHGIVTAEFVQPVVIGMKDGALQRFVGQGIKEAARTGEEHLGLDPISILVLQSRSGVPSSRIVLEAEIFVKTNGFKMFFLIDLADAFVLTNGQALGIMGNTDWGYSFSEHPGSGRYPRRVFHNLGRAV